MFLTVFDSPMFLTVFDSAYERIKDTISAFMALTVKWQWHLESKHVNNDIAKWSVRDWLILRGQWWGQWRARSFWVNFRSRTSWKCIIITRVPEGSTSTKQ